jgi:hypothetical protein
VPPFVLDFDFDRDDFFAERTSPRLVGVDTSGPARPSAVSARTMCR